MDELRYLSEDRPPPRWLVHLLAVAASIAAVSLLAMGVWVALLFLHPAALP